MYKALDIAKWLIEYNFGKSETEGEDLITNLKLQKLLYYAQSASLAFYNKRLFEDKFEAWRHGPVIPQIYRTYKKYGSNPITEVEFVDLDKSTTSLLINVYNYFGKMSAWGLAELTHEETPWQEAYEKSQDPQKNNDIITIDENLMKEVFLEKYAK
ncbi:type II toxin-antitoxin system antitoxin SocA domain-containing protein [uncultured Sneathia sp.]|uniref:Panacea domain-containing protein n=1 Tax=uncultured Sneathia sp. TaxID=278067 RepID=UPI0025974F37|nr:type II toxin-antitoxin system antitoxin SocA domain-containing protein [uncultured Sneathia sp.]